MNAQEFLKELIIYDNGFKQILDRLRAKETDIVVATDWHIILYCRRQLQVASKVVPESMEISAHIARSFLELEIILKWLKQDPQNYKIFASDAEYAHLNLMKSKKEAIEAYDPRFTEKFSNNISKLEKELTDSEHAKNQDKLSPLYDIKGTAKKIDEKLGKLVRGKFDFFSKLSHPTSWLITMDPNSEEVTVIKREAMAEIKRAVITILNTFDDNHKAN